MILDLSISPDKKKAEMYFSKLLEDGAKIELKKIPKRRTLNQNSYLHAILTLYATEWGWTLEEAKTYVKRTLGYTYVKNNELFLTSTSTMNTKELTEFIDKFRNLSASQGFYLPSGDEIGQNWEYFARELDRAEVMQNKYSY